MIDTSERAVCIRATQIHLTRAIESLEKAGIGDSNACRLIATAKLALMESEELAELAQLVSDH